MNKLIFTLLCVYVLSAPGPVQANVVSKGVQELLEALGRLTTAEGAGELADFGGKKAVRAILEKGAGEGGDHLVERMVHYGQRYGLEALQVMEHAPLAYVRAFDALPEQVMRKALWAVQREPERMTKLVRQYGADALHTAAKHPGVGSDLVQSLGTQGIRLGKRLPEGPFLQTAGHLDSMADVPARTRREVVDFILQAPKRSLEWLEAHPRILYTATGVGTFLAVKDQILGQEREVTVNPDGSKTIREKGFLPRTMDRFYNPLAVIIYVAAGLLLIGGLMRIRRIHRREIKADKETI